MVYSSYHVDKSFDIYMEQEETFLLQNDKTWRKKIGIPYIWSQFHEYLDRCIKCIHIIQPDIYESISEQV